MKQNKFLILLVYYERPSLVLNALTSIMKTNYSNFEVVFIDDGSNERGEPIVRRFCAPIIDRIKFVYINHDKEQKIKQGGSVHGKYINDAIHQSDADYVIILCDDDALHPDYLFKLNEFYNNHQEYVYSYGHVIEYDPEKEILFEQTPIEIKKSWLNKTHDLNPYCSVDASQVSWSVKRFNEDGISFPYPQTVSLDATVYQQMHIKWGACKYNGIIGQYKAMFRDQLGKRNNNLYEVIVK